MAVRVVGTDEMRYPLNQEVLLLCTCLASRIRILTHVLYDFLIHVVVFHVTKSCVSFDERLEYELKYDLKSESECACL